MNEENRRPDEMLTPGNTAEPISADTVEETVPENVKTAEEDIPTVDAEEIPAAEVPPVKTETETQSEQYSPYGNRPYDPNNYTANRNPYSAGHNQRSGYNPPPSPPANRNRGLKVFAAIVCVLLVFSLIFSAGVVLKYKDKNNFTPSENSVGTVGSDKKGDGPSLNIASAPAEVEGALTTAQIAKKVKPSIVGIVVYTNNSSSTAGEGTGVIMGEDSTGTSTYIVTCAHVINEAGIRVKVQTENGTTYDAEIVGFDSRTDLGVVKIKAKGLPAAEFGNSDILNVGDSVFAIGNPGGVEFFGSFTGGYVSAIDRPVSSDIGYTMKCIQHDAAINPGNSGGALVNVYGQVIGINSQKIAATDYEGMGFAIPTTSAKNIIDSLIAYGYVPNRPKLGISYYPVSASAQYSMIAQIQGLPAGTLIIDKIDEESSLASTEARQYDMIVAVNGKDLTTADVLLELIDKGKVGDTFTLTLCRVNSNYTLSKFDVTAKLVEDKGGSQVEVTEPQYVDPFEYFNPFGY